MSAILLLLADQLYSQTDLTVVTVPVTLQQYLSKVAKGNLGYIAEQLNVDIAEANYNAARVFPDPEISVTYSDNEDNTLQMGKSIETGISYPVSLGNKRGATIALAEKQSKLANASLTAFLQDLKANASISFFQALRDQNNVTLESDGYYRLRGLAKADSLRLASGEIMEIDAMQSALEAKAQYNNVIQSETDLHNALITLSKLQGRTTDDTLIIPCGSFPQTEMNFSLTDLINNAIKRRGEIQIAVKNKEISENNLRLLKANRAFEFSLEAGYSHNYIVKNELAPAPAYNSYSAGIAIPLKFSGLNRGEIKAAACAKTQSEIAYHDVELRIIAEVTQAYNNFISMQKQIEIYNKGLIENAEKILNGRIYSYQKGECGLIEVLNAQRTFNDLRKDYNETLFEYTAALIELQYSAAIDMMN